MLKTKELYQWDTNKRLEVDNRIITEVQFSNIFSEEALVVAVYEENGKRYANIPDELLTEPYTLHAYASCGDCVEEEAEFRVIKRAKPDDYTYSALPIATGSFTYEDDGSNYITIEHNLDKMPKQVILYCVKKGSTPSATNTFQSYNELLHAEAIEDGDGTYTNKTMYVYYTRTSYYSSKSSTATLQYRTLQDVKTATYPDGSGIYSICAIGKNSFQIYTSTLRDNVEYFWTVIG